MGDRIVVISTVRDADPVYVRKCVDSVQQQTELHEHMFIDDGSYPPTGIGAALLVADAAAPGLIRLLRYPRGDNRCALQNVYEEIHRLEDSAIVCWLDGDDWLAHPKALERVRAEYDRTDKEVWLTWGQFEYHEQLCEKPSRAWTPDGSLHLCSQCWDELNERSPIRGVPDTHGNCERLIKQPGWACDYSAGITATGSFRHDIWRATHLKTFRAGLFKRIHKSDLGRKQEHEVWEWTKHAIDLAVMFPMLEMAREHGSFIPDVLYTYSGENGGSSGPGSHTWAEAERIRDMSLYSRLEARPW